jgi:hypothetical protein
MKPYVIEIQVLADANVKVFANSEEEAIAKVTAALPTLCLHEYFENPSDPENYSLAFCLMDGDEEEFSQETIEEFLENTKELQIEPVAFIVG